jgi:hypothetical protein
MEQALTQSTNVALRPSDAEQLRKEVAPTATVLRGGEWREIPRRGIVPGDPIRLSAGDLVPADARLVESRDLHVQQAAAVRFGALFFQAAKAQHPAQQCLLMRAHKRVQP